MALWRWGISAEVSIWIVLFRLVFCQVWSMLFESRSECIRVLDQTCKCTDPVVLLCMYPAAFLYEEMWAVETIATVNKGKGSWIYKELSQLYINGPYAMFFLILNRVSCQVSLRRHIIHIISRTDTQVGRITLQRKCSVAARERVYSSALSNSDWLFLLGLFLAKFT